MYEKLLFSFFPTKKYKLWGTIGCRCGSRDKTTKEQGYSYGQSLWRSNAIEEMFWETEATMRSHYSYFFDDLYVQNFEDKFFYKEGRNVIPVISI